MMVTAMPLVSATTLPKRLRRLCDQLPVALLCVFHLSVANKHLEALMFPQPVEDRLR